MKGIPGSCCVGRGKLCYVRHWLSNRLQHELHAMMGPNMPLFDSQRMIPGGFGALVDLKSVKD